MLQQERTTPDAEQIWHHALELPNFQKQQPNKPLFFTHYLVSRILLEQQKMD
jgi:hypothetical protein